MYRAFFINITLIAFTLFSSCSTKSTVPSTLSKKTDLYILVGQSNMAGRGAITPEFANISNPNVFMFTKNKQWAIAKHPIHFDKPSMAGVGPGLAFGIKMAEKTPGKKIGLIPCAVGGTSINKWVAGAYDEATNTHPYDDAIERIKAAKEFGNFKGILWLQGESDSKDLNPADYQWKLKQLIASLRAAAGNSSLPVVIGELGTYQDSYKNFNKQMPELASQIPFSAITSSEGLAHKGDGIHFDSASATIMGERMALKMLNLKRK